jgi:hypothetical protein
VKSVTGPISASYSHFMAIVKPRNNSKSSLSATS